MNEENNNLSAALPRRSRRLATIIPASHWISLGYSEEQAQGMEELQNDIKKLCDGDFEDETDLTLQWINDEHIILHHEMMTSHWNKLFKKMNGRTSVQSFDIRRFYMPVSLLGNMFSALHPQSFIPAVKC